MWEGLPALQVLFLSDNDIVTLRAVAFHSLTTLKKLHMANNQLTHIRGNMWEGLEALEELHLYRNKLRLLQPKAFRPLTNLKTLFAFNNHRGGSRI